jgi:hypothetical protein
MKVFQQTGFQPAGAMMGLVRGDTTGADRS